MKKNTYGKTSVILASLVLPITLLVSSIIAWTLKTNNTDNVDVTSGLAYIEPVLGSTLLVFGILSAISLVIALLGLKRDASAELSKLGIFILVLVAVFSVAAGVASKGASDAEESYRNQESVEFFQELE